MKRKSYIIVLLVICCAPVASYSIQRGLLYSFRILGFVEPIDEVPRGVTRRTDILDAGGKVVFQDSQGDVRKYTILEKMPQNLLKAFTCVEDRSFWDHPGIDVRAIFRAAMVNLRSLSVQQGGSTITQQVVRNTFLSREKTFRRKWLEVLYAFRLEAHFGKHEILEKYLNNIYLGNHSIGVAAAAKNYFRKNLDDLTLSEIAILASLPKAPSYYAPHRFPGHMKKRLQTVELMLRKCGVLSAEANIKFEGIAIHSTPYRKENEYRHYFNRVLRQIRSRYGVVNRHLIVKTHFDTGLNKQLLDAVIADKKVIQTSDWFLYGINPKTGAVRVYIAGGGSKRDLISEQRSMGFTKRLVDLSYKLMSGMELDSPLDEVHSLEDILDGKVVLNDTYSDRYSKYIESLGLDLFKGDGFLDLRGNASKVATFIAALVNKGVGCSLHLVASYWGRKEANSVSSRKTCLGKRLFDENVAFLSVFPFLKGSGSSQKLWRIWPTKNGAWTSHLFEDFVLIGWYGHQDNSRVNFESAVRNFSENVESVLNKNGLRHYVATDPVSVGFRRREKPKDGYVPFKLKI